MSMKSDFSVQNNVVNVCSSYLCMVFPYNGNVQYPQNDRLPLFTLCLMEATKGFHSVMNDS